MPVVNCFSGVSYLRIDTTLTPKQRGRQDAGRGATLFDCPYSDPDNVREWQEGWRQRRSRIEQDRRAVSEAMVVADGAESVSES